MTKTNSLREEIRYELSIPFIDMDKDELTNRIISKIEKTIDKVEKDYKKELTPWGQKQPMTTMYPKEMDALNKVRKKLK